MRAASGMPVPGQSVLAGGSTCRSRHLAVARVRIFHSEGWLNFRRADLARLSVRAFGRDLNLRQEAGGRVLAGRIARWALKTILTVAIVGRDVCRNDFFV